MRTLAGIVLSGLAAAAAVGQAPAAAVQEFKVGDAWGRDAVEFKSSAPIEEIVGTTNEVTGVLRANPANLKTPSPYARLKVPVGSFKTGIGMRDGHVGDALGKKDHPTAVFTLDRVDSVSADSLQPNKGVDIRASGILELNGVKRSLPVTARITYIPKGGPFSEVRPGNIVKL